MKRLSPEHIIPDPPTLEELEVGHGAWVNRVSLKVDREGALFLPYSAQIFDEEYETNLIDEEYETNLIGRRRRVRVDRGAAGWSVKIPREHLPLRPMRMEAVKTVCHAVDEIEIVD